MNEYVEKIKKEIEKLEEKQKPLLDEIEVLSKHYMVCQYKKLMMESQLIDNEIMNLISDLPK